MKPVMGFVLYLLGLGIVWAVGIVLVLVDVIARVRMAVRTRR